MQNQYIKHSNNSPKIPLAAALWTITSLKVFEAPEWAYGVVIALYLLAAIGGIIRIVTEEAVDVVKRKDGIN